MNRLGVLFLVALVVLTTFAQTGAVASFLESFEPIDAEICAPGSSDLSDAPEPILNGGLLESLYESAWLNGDTRMLHDFFHVMGMQPTGEYSGYTLSESRVASLMFEGPDNSTGTIIFATPISSQDGESTVVAVRQAPVADTVYRIATTYTIEDDAIAEGPSIQMNGGTTKPYCPYGQCKVDKTCGGDHDEGCLYFCPLACTAIPNPAARAACVAACWFACKIPEYDCSYCEPC